MSIFPPKTRALFIVPLLGLAAGPVWGAWADSSAGLPLLQHFSAKDMGGGDVRYASLEDKLGRLFVGGNELQVFDGQSWHSFPVGSSRTLLSLAFGPNGRLWAGAVNEIGYFTEETLGAFQYHSLTSYLPRDQQLVGEPWGCVPIGSVVYFICRDKVLRWDGSGFQILPYEGKEGRNSRLFPLRLGEEYWFHHVETGLYRLNEAGPRLEIPADMLPSTGVLGLIRDETGLVVASGSGLYRPGHPPQRISNDQLSAFIKENRLASFAPLQGGNLAFGTFSGGIIVSNSSGSPLRIFDTDDGLPGRYASPLSLDSHGYLWSGTSNGMINFESAGRVTMFDTRNGLKGTVNKLVQLPGGRSLALTFEGVFQLVETGINGSRFQPVSQLPATYFDLLAMDRGWLLFRHGGIDFFDGAAMTNVCDLTGTTVYRALPIRSTAGACYILESGGLYRLTQETDRSFTHTFLAKLPALGLTLHEDSAGRLWIGTASQGAFLYEPTNRQLSPVTDQTSGRPFTGLVSVTGVAQGILLLGNRGVFQARPDGTELHELPGAPAINAVKTCEAPGEGNLLVAFKRTTANAKGTQGLGVLAFGSVGQVQWRELDVPGLGTIGLINTMEFRKENARPVLWLGGSEGALRLDYETLQPVQNPAPPVVQLDLLNAGQIPGTSGFSFSFQDHRLKFHVFTGEYSRTKDWLVQSRLGNVEWSAPMARRSFEFSNLSEGDYRFEVRSVNAAGLTSEPSAFAFRILPPWYRSNWAFAGYLVGLGVVGLAVVRVRERQIRARNEELEATVTVRTAELVKANAAKDEFLAGISHEIRNPMSGVIGIADNFKTEGLDPDSRRKFGLLRQCATHLSSLLEDILDFSRVQAGAVDIDPKPFDLAELMESIVAMTAADSEKRGIPVEIAVSPAVPRHLVGDAKRVRQILLNFTSNALKFSGRGKVSVTVWCKTLAPERTEVIFAVSDEGPGISAEEQQRLFTRFERGAASQQGRVPGTGLGLALCKGLAEKMGGRIWLESEPGHGSCFSFSAPFPIAATPAESAAVAVAPVAAQLKTALVVDDQEYNRVVLVDLLEALGYRVQGAAEGTTALTLAAKEPFDVVLLDFNLPGLSGLDITHGIRALPNASAKAYILATTAFSTPEKRAQCLAAGMNAFLGKPVTMERLRKALAEMPTSTPAPAPAVAAPDGLANLRLLARKKKTPFATELALYLSEFDVELEHLLAAVRAENPADTGHYAHLLYGRCAFIAERDLEQTFRQIEAAGATAQWDGARALGRDGQTQLAALRLRLAAAGGPVAPPASGR